jgi:hypothetical protein
VTLTWTQSIQKQLCSLTAQKAQKKCHLSRVANAVKHSAFVFLFCRPQATSGVALASQSLK